MVALYILFPTIFSTFASPGGREKIKTCRDICLKLNGFLTRRGHVADAVADMSDVARACRAGMSGVARACRAGVSRGRVARACRAGAWVSLGGSVEFSEVQMAVQNLQR